MAANNKCSDCGIDREPKYKNDSCCKECRAKRNKARRVERMLAKGKRPQGSGRSPNCSRCSQLKTAEFLTSGYCGPCKYETIKLKRQKARLERGQLPFGEGRRPTCYRCGAIKENPRDGYCNKCDAERDRAVRLRNKQSDQFLQREREKYAVNKSCPIFRYKKAVREFTNNNIRSGFLVRQPCEVCKSEKKADAHHDDYTKPLDVRWLCRKHHNEHHRLHGEGKLPSQLLKES